MRKEIGWFKCWFNIPQALSASENEDNKTAIFYSNLFWSTQCLYFYLLSVRQSLIVKLLVEQEFQEYCTSPKEASCKIGKVQAMFYLPFFVLLNLPEGEREKLASFGWPMASLVRNWIWHKALWPGLWVVSAFSEGIWTSQSKGTYSAWTKCIWVWQLHL